MPSLTKSEILRGEKRMELLYKSGKRRQADPLMVIKLETDQHEEQPLKAAFVVPKKYFRKATIRNRLRRQLREVYRLNKQPLIDVMKTKNKTLQLLFIYTGKTPVTFAELQQKLVLLLQRLMHEHA